MLHSGLPKNYLVFFSNYFYYIYRFITDLMPINNYSFSAKKINYGLNFKSYEIISIVSHIYHFIINIYIPQSFVNKQK